jgi:hypothetical protein
MAKVLTGQRKKEYESLDGFFTFTISQTSSVYFNITALIGNTLFIDWDDEDNPDVEEEFTTTGVSQRLSHNYSNSNRERTIRIHGSGVYVMSIFNVSGFRNIKDFPFNSENCSMLPNLKQLLLTDSDYFHWDEDCDWSLLPKINVIDLQSCDNLSGFSMIDPEVDENYPAALSSLIINNTPLTGITIRNYPPLRNITISGRSELKYCDLEGCTNLRTIYFNDNYELVSANFKNCSGMISSYFDDVYRLNNISFEGCTSMISANLNDVNAYGTAEDFNINWTGCNSLKDLKLYNIKGKDILPSPEDAPSLSILSARYISGGISGDLELNGYNSISSIFFEYVDDLKNINCLGNRSIVSGRFISCKDLENATFENCTKLSGITFETSSEWNELEYLKVRNCINLKQIITNYCGLEYGFEITQCNALSALYMNYTNLRSFYLSGFENLMYLELYGNDNSSLSKFEIEDCNRLESVRVENNKYSLTEIKVTNCRYSSLYIDADYCYSINKVTLNGLNTSTSRMNDLLYDLKQYSFNNAGEINISNCSYLPSGNYITDLTNNGWTYNVS